MERAASAVAFEIVSRWVPSQRIIIFAGPGNNGGDALAVARLLIDQGYKPEVLLFRTKDLSDDCAINRQRLVDMEYPSFVEVQKKFTVPEISKRDVVVDGLFGNGLSSNLRGGYTALAKLIYESEAFVVSIDLPSGLFPEFNSTNILNNIVHANLTLTFQFPRLAFFFRENARCLGEWKVLDIGLSQEAIRQTPSNYYLIDRVGVKDGLQPRNPFADKHDFGRMLLVAGSFGMGGAAVLAAKAALRTGWALSMSIRRRAATSRFRRQCLRPVCVRTGEAVMLQRLCQRRSIRLSPVLDSARMPQRCRQSMIFCGRRRRLFFLMPTHLTV